MLLSDSEHLHSYSEVKCLQGYSKIFKLAIEHSVVIVTAGSQSRSSQSESYE